MTEERAKIISRLNSDIEKYLGSGGKIKKIPTGVSSIKYGKSIHKLKTRKNNNEQRDSEGRHCDLYSVIDNHLPE